MTVDQRPVAIEPSRVMLLDEAEQQELIDRLLAVEDIFERSEAIRRLWKRIHWGEEYTNPTDEYVRKTFAKRRLEAEIHKLNARLADLDKQLVEEWTEQGRHKDGHEATGATLSLNRRVYAKLNVDTAGLSKTVAEQIRKQHKAQLGAVLPEIGLGELVRPDFNLNTLSAVFVERIREYDERQRMLPEHERAPKAPGEFLPEQLRGLLVIDATPHVQVRA